MRKRRWKSRRRKKKKNRRKKNRRKNRREMKNNKTTVYTFSSFPSAALISVMSLVSVEFTFSAYTARFLVDIRKLPLSSGALLATESITSRSLGIEQVMENNWLEYPHGSHC